MLNHRVLQTKINTLFFLYKGEVMETRIIVKTKLKLRSMRQLSLTVVITLLRDSVIRVKLCKILFSFKMEHALYLLLMK